MAVEDGGQHKDHKKEVEGGEGWTSGLESWEICRRRQESGSEHSPPGVLLSASEASPTLY